MLMPSIFEDDLFDDFFRYPSAGLQTAGLMKTDIKDLEDRYEVTIDMPGVKKEDIQADLKDGYLTVQASSSSSKEEKDEDNKYLRRERYTGSYSRSFYVGGSVSKEDIKAKFENGTLKLEIPKKKADPALEEPKYIAIEG